MDSIVVYNVTRVLMAVVRVSVSHLYILRVHTCPLWNSEIWAVGWNRQRLQLLPTRLVSFEWFTVYGLCFKYNGKTRATRNYNVDASRNPNPPRQMNFSCICSSNCTSNSIHNAIQFKFKFRNLLKSNRIYIKNIKDVNFFFAKIHLKLVKSTKTIVSETTFYD